MSERPGHSPEEMETKAISPRLPGGPVSEKPLESGGKFYDPLYPPKIQILPDGSQQVLAGSGQEIGRDEAYSRMFWVDQPTTMRETMKQNVEIAFRNGLMAMFVTGQKTPEGKIDIGQNDKEKLSAYRVLAKEMGYTIGSYEYKEKSGTVTATITKE